MNGGDNQLQLDIYRICVIAYFSYIMLLFLYIMLFSYHGNAMK